MKKLALILFTFSIAFSQDYPFRANVVPGTTNTYDLGRSWMKWDTLYVRYIPWVTDSLIRHSDSLRVHRIALSALLDSVMKNVKYHRQAQSTIDYLGDTLATRYSPKDTVATLLTQANAATKYLTSVSATSPVQSTGGLTPIISMLEVGTESAGYLSSEDWTEFKGKLNASDTIYMSQRIASKIDTSKMSLGNSLDTTRIVYLNKANNGELIVGASSNSVTAGTGSAVLGGYNNTVTGSYSIINSGNGNLIEGARSGAMGVNDSLVGSGGHENYIFGDYCKVNSNTYGYGYGNWLFGQYLSTDQYGVWAFGADDSFEKKLIPFAGSIVFVNENVQHWLSNTTGLYGGRRWGVSSPHTRDTGNFELSYEKLGSAVDSLGYGSWSITQHRSPVMTSGHLNWTKSKYYLGFNRNGVDDIQFNFYTNEDLGVKPWGNITFNNGKVGILNGGATSIVDSLLTVNGGSHFIGNTIFDGKNYFGSPSAGRTLNIASPNDVLVGPAIRIRADADTTYGVDFDNEESNIGYLALYSVRGGSRTLGLVQSWSSASSGSVFVGYTSDPSSGNKFAVNGNSYFGGTGTFTGTLSADSLHSTKGITGTTGTFSDKVQATTFNATSMPSDSTGLSTGDLYFNSTTGAVHRKF